MNVQSYLESLPEAILSRLFKSPSSCLAIFRLLSQLAKTIVLRSLFNQEPIQLVDVDNFVKPSHRRLQIEAMQNLRRLHIIKEKFSTKTVVVNPGFARSLRIALTSGQENASFGVPVQAAAAAGGAPTREQIQHAASQKWESILQYMVGGSAKPNNSTLVLLKSSQMMVGPSVHTLTITSAGFQFLLQDLHSQVWALLLHYLNQCTSLDMDPVEVLNFIFMLGSLELGTAYTLESSSATQERMLADLTAFGLIQHTREMGPQFYPTHLATMLTSESKGDSARESRGFIIIETNYRIYAYTDNRLQLSILNLFCQMRSRFANLCVGRITRESIRFALEKGITADQIIEYLKANAHEQMIQAESQNILPPTVSDQIILWQLEMDRLRATNGYLYRDFKTAKEYNLIVSYAREMGALVWKNDTKRIFFVSKESNEQVLDYINRKMH